MPSASEREERRVAVRAALGQIVEEYGPDWTADCVYFNLCDLNYIRGGRPTPVCLVGHLFERIEPDTFTALIEAEERGTEVNRLKSMGITVHFAEGDNLMMNALAELQNNQDAGYSWGVALQEYDNCMAGI
ncbi:hypothetical protein SEA_PAULODIABOLI_327 [Microbacterium phage PauloDiaboli]|nr:hypothetical protein SEA_PAULODIABOLI_327 [Microbacterium phage PauloDiaboli]